jgi:hypothetical protein
MDKEHIIQEIETLQAKHNQDLEALFDKLRIASVDSKEQKDTNPNILEIGDQVTILNPSKQGDRRGTVIRIGLRVTVDTTRGKVVRTRKNLRKV